MKLLQTLLEIYELSDKSFKGGSEEIENWLEGVHIKPLLQKSKPLPGNSDFTYLVLSDKKDKILGRRLAAVGYADAWIGIFDPKQMLCVGYISLQKASGHYVDPALKKMSKSAPHYQVESISVDEKYRSQRIALSLYGLVFTELKGILISGSSQTKGGMAMWKNISNVPGVKVFAMVYWPDLLNAKILKKEYEKLFLPAQDKNENEAHQIIDKALKSLPGAGRYVYDNDFIMFPTSVSGTRVESKYVNIYGLHSTLLVSKFN